MIDIPPQYDRPFIGRMVVEVLPFEQVKGRCANAWDTANALACSWTFQDPQNSEAVACHVVYPKLEDGWWTEDDELAAIRIETANCNGWHDKEMKENS